MPRPQAIVIRGDRVLMVKHRQDGEQWWCLRGGAQEAGETPDQGALRELREEFRADGAVVRQLSLVSNLPDDETHTFLVDIGEQTPSLGCDPEVAAGRQAQVLFDVQWLRLRDITERDRVFLWAAGLLGTGDFATEVEGCGIEKSYPGSEHPA